MLWHLAQPLDAGISHGGVGVQAFGDRMTDDGLTFLPEQGDELLLHSNQHINLRRLVVQERRDLLLFFKRGIRDTRIRDELVLDAFDRRTFLCPDLQESRCVTCLLYTSDAADE